MTTNSMALVGCTPTPLANYLKALGVLRLLTSPSNNVNETEADPQVRGWWGNESFHLRTRLDREALMRFFLEDYAPSPIIAPWNGGSGFYPKDNKDGIAPLMASEVAKRFSRMASTIQMASDEITNRNLASSPKDNEKARFVARLRSCLPDFALDWLDATLSLSGDRLNFPQLLGTGGNDGRLDFTNNFMQRLVSTGRPLGLFDAVTGSPKPHAEPFLRTSLFADLAPSLQSFAIGQFAPGSAGGPNASTGYEASSNVNPWDFVLALEGAVIFAGTATRRHQGSPEYGASFPFTVRPVGAGWGGVTDTDEGSTRAEFWAPLWNQPATCGELEGLLKEGRAVLNGRTARDGLDFARAAASLGVSRGVNAFERYGFVMRAGKAYLAAPLGTRKVESSTRDAAALIGALDAGGWLGQVRRLARGGNAPARARAAVKRLEDALFIMSGASVSPRSVQGALCALGDLVQWLVGSRDGMENISPPPRLSSRWVRMADDRTPEYRVAAALASLGRWSSRHTDASDGVVLAARSKKRVPMAAHFAPLDPDTISQERRSWASQNGRRVVWNAGDLIPNLIAVLERRLIDVEIDDPLDAAMSAQLVDIAAFLEQDFDEARCGRLLAGLVWAQPAWLSAGQRPRPIVPFAYAALKLIFTSDMDLETLEKAKLIPPECRIPVPSGLVARLRSGHMDEAVRLALARARASGIACPFAHPGIANETKTGRRLAAALLIPLDEYGLKPLMQRAYPTEAE